MGLEAKKLELVNEYNILAETLQKAFEVGAFEGYNIGYNEGFEDAKNSLKSAISDGVRSGSKVCAKELRTYTKKK